MLLLTVITCLIAFVVHVLTIIHLNVNVQDILAAGEALGRAGLWRDCLVFASDSDSVSTYGPVSY